MIWQFLVGLAGILREHAFDIFTDPFDSPSKDCLLCQACASAGYFTMLAGGPDYTFDGWPIDEEEQIVFDGEVPEDLDLPHDENSL